MKNIFVSFFIIFSFHNSSSQNTFTSFVKADNSDSSIIYEKVYLHVDRTFYISGDNVWFKAYLVNASTNTLIDNSKNLHVELISSSLKILQKRIVQIEDGVGFGDFQLSDSIKSGSYLIRAYTNWMRNFGNDFFFEKEITIVNSIDAENLAKKKFLSTRSKVDIQFFPEGGSLVDGIPTNLAFKAIDTLGIGCDVKGIIKSGSGKIITMFQSSHLGMGVFLFTPSADEVYTAEGTTSKGQKFIARLPEIFRTGISIQVKERNDNEIRLLINVNQRTLQSFSNNNFILKISSHNQEYLAFRVKIASPENTLIIPTKELPEGISRISLVNDIDVPQCERLVYINKKQEYKIAINSDKSVYSPRSKVTLNISVKDTLDIPELATLSLSVIDSSAMKNGDSYNSDIISYFLLESELKGHIENPGYYCNPKNEERWKNLDLLLLTQGWRDFIWKYIPNTDFIPQYTLETGVTISGKIRRVILNKPIDKTNVSLTLFADSSRYYYFTQTDTLGRFCFDSLCFSGKLKMILSANAYNKRLKELIMMDSMIYIPSKVDYQYSLNSNDFLSTITELKNESIYRRMVKQKYHLSDTIMIGEVIVKKYRPFDDNHKRIYNHADYSITVTENDAGYPDIFSLIKGRVPGVSIKASYVSGFKEYKVEIGGAKRLPFLATDNSPLFLLDGVPTSIETVADIPVYLIDKIEVISQSAIFGVQGFFGAISIFSKSGNGLYRPPSNSISKIVKGYDKPRIFYAPRYENSENEIDKPDLRTTIHWEPNIVTSNEEGETVSFFNADKSGHVLVNVEGITQTGIPVKGSFMYEVKKNNKSSSLSN